MTAVTDYLEGASIYGASGEQLQCWRHHYSPPEGKQIELLMLDLTLERPDVEAINRSVEILVRRHESLRTFFRILDGEIKQCIIPYDPALFTPHYYDVNGKKDYIGAIREITDLQKKYFLNLDMPPLVRSCLFRVTDTTYYFCLWIHHIIADDWSMSVMYRELSGYYEAFRNRRPVDPEPLKMQLRDYASLQHKWFEENGDVFRKYWKDKLGSLPDVYLFDAINGFGPGNGQSATRDSELFDILNTAPAGSVVYRIDSELFARLTGLASYLRSGIQAIMNASLHLLFFVLAGRRKTLIGMPAARRQEAGTESIIGYLVGFIYLCQSIREEVTISQLVKKVYLDFLQSCQYIICDFSELKMDHRMRIQCDVTVNYMSREMTGGEKLPAEPVSGQVILEHPIYFALKYHISEYQDGLLCKWMYNTSLYSSAAIDLITAVHAKILSAMCNKPDITIAEMMQSLS